MATTSTTGRPSRPDRTVRATYTLNEGAHALLKGHAISAGRDAGQQVEQAVLLYEAALQLEELGQPFTLGALTIKTRQIWQELEAQTKKEDSLPAT